MRQPFRHRIPAWVLTAALTLTVQAADGVIEINQAIVEANGGFPYVISAPGSYILTGNLTVPDESTTAIEVRADDVTLDLNGFAIQCTDSDGASCDQSSFTGDNGDGVTAFIFTDDFGFENFANTVVRNGTIRGMGRDGVLLRSGFVEGIQALQNGRAGIFVREGAVTNCLARDNGATGIGIRTGVATTNVATFNDGDGIGVRSGVARNNVSNGNGGDGIGSEGSALVLGNRITDNSGAALKLIPDEDGGVSGYADNVIEGTVTGGQQMGCNLIDGSQICPNPLPF